MGIVPYELLNDICPKSFSEIQDMMGEAQFVGDPPGVLEIVQGAAAARLGAGLVEQMHRNPNDLQPAPMEQRRSHGTVDPTRHGHQDSARRTQPLVNGFNGYIQGSTRAQVRRFRSRENPRPIKKSRGARQPHRGGISPARAAPEKKPWMPR